MQSRKAAIISRNFDDFFAEQNVESLLANIEYTLLILEVERFSPADELQLYYSLGTVHGDLIQLVKNLKVDTEYLLEKQIFYFRKALEVYNLNLNIEKIETTIMSQLYINLGNTYLTVGRIFEAIHLFNKAIDIYSEHPIALGNQGRAYILLGQILWEPGYKETYFHLAYNRLVQALKYQEDYPHLSAYNVFEKDKEYIESYFNKSWLESQQKYDEYDLGKAEEKEYRLWCLENTLFLNPLNDILKISMVAYDPFHLPSMIMSLEYDSRLHGFFNQIKQEYISSRYLFYESIQPKKQEHFSDREVTLWDTLDYSIHSISDFKLKMTYRALYSLLDKVAFFINQYFSIGIKEKDVNYRSIWWRKINGKNSYDYKNPINTKVKDNIALNGIYWIFKDFNEYKDKQVKPQSKILKELRDHIEHKYLKTTIYPLSNADLLPPPYGDNLVQYITSDQLYDHTFELMETVRFLIIYLGMAIHIEEEQKEKLSLTVPITLFPIKDEWKL